MRTRPAELEDLKHIQRLNALLFEHEFKKFDTTIDCAWPFGKEAEKYFTQRIVQEDGCAFVCCVEDQVVGYLLGGVMEKVAYRNISVVGELENMYVQEEFRGKRVGTELVQAFYAWCADKGIKRVRVEASAGNKEGVNFYTKQGFKPYSMTLERNLP